MTFKIGAVDVMNNFKGNSYASDGIAVPNNGSYCVRVNTSFTAAHNLINLQIKVNDEKKSQQLVTVPGFKTVTCAWSGELEEGDKISITIACDAVAPAEDLSSTFNMLEISQF